MRVVALRVKRESQRGEDEDRFDDREKPRSKCNVEMLRQTGLHDWKCTLPTRLGMKMGSGKKATTGSEWRPGSPVCYLLAVSLTPISSNRPSTIWIISLSTTRFFEMASFNEMEMILLARSAAMQPNSPRCT